jgi:hypothetical protein
MSEPKVPHITTDDVYGDIGLTDEDLARANEMTAEQGITLKVGADAWTKLQEALDAPPRDMPRLKALLEGPRFFKRSAT